MSSFLEGVKMTDCEKYLLSIKKFEIGQTVFKRLVKFGKETKIDPWEVECESVYDYKNNMSVIETRCCLEGVYEDLDIMIGRNEWIRLFEELSLEEFKKQLFQQMPLSNDDTTIVQELEDRRFLGGI